MITLEQVIKNVVIKRDVEAEAQDAHVYTTSGIDTYELYSAYKNAYYGTDSLTTYDFQPDELKNFIDDFNTLKYVLKEPDSLRYYLDEKELDQLLEFKRGNTIKRYTEYNNYYRSLMGLPEVIYVGGKYTINPAHIIYPPEIPGITKNVPLHELTTGEKNILRTNGILEIMYNEYKYAWIKNVAFHIDVLTARSAKNFDIVYADYDIDYMSEFVQNYRLIRNNYMVNYYKEFDTTQYQYYEPIVCLHLLMAALAATNASSINSIKIEEIDIYTLFDSFGLPRFKFNKSYLFKIAEKINILLEEKGTNIGLMNLSKIFDGMNIFKYFIVKKMKNDGQDDVTGMDNMEKYELFFIKTPLDCDDPYDYYDLPNNVVPYSKVVNADDKWGFEDDKLEAEIKDMDFAYAESKYLSLDNTINIVTFSMEVAYFYRYILEHRTNFSEIKFYMDTIDKHCDLVEVVTYLQCLIFKKYGLNPDIPDNMNTILYMYAIKNDIDYDKIKRNFREHFKWHPDAELRKNIDDFIDIISGEKVEYKRALDIFEKNLSIIKSLNELKKKVVWRDDFEAIESTIQAITYGEKIPALYNGKTDLEDFLYTYKKDGHVFRLRLLELSKDDNPTVAYNREIGECLQALRTGVDSIKQGNVLRILDSMQNIYSDVDLIKYLEEIIEFFKSYTQDLISSGFTYVVDDIEDQVKITERLTRKMRLEGWEVVLLSTILNKYNKELVTIIKNALFKESEYIHFNETLQRIDKDGRVYRLD